MFINRALARQAIILLAFLGLVFQSASAQYFGQNNVIYRNFNFKILKTEHFNIYYYQNEERGLQDAARMAERWYERHSRMLGHELNGPQPLILYASSPQFFETNVVAGLGEGVGGVTEALRRRIVLPFAGPLNETNHVIGHELVHAFQYSLTGEHGGSGAIQNSAVLKLPLWFIEGMAEFLSLGPYDPNTAMYLRDAMISKKRLPGVKDLDNPNYFPYRWGQALLAYIAGRWGDDRIGDMLNSAGSTGDINKTIRSVLEISPDSLSRDWHNAIHAEYDSLSKITKTPKDYGKQLISHKLGSGNLNVGPVLSPDGKYLIFYSEKSLFGIDLYMADAQTGKIISKLVETELDPHYSSLEFIYSAGSWDPEGKRIVFSAVIKDVPSLAIYDVAKDKKVQERVFHELGEIYNPAWSPDGRQIAFSALAGGFTDLFVYDTETDSLRRITEDAYADLQPAWSPDGSKLAFVTDRFSTDLKNLAPGHYEIALIDMKTGDISQVRLFDSGKHIDPQWSPDGKNLYFVSDHSGISNIYRTDLAGNVYQITDLFTGVSGITDISPAMSVARDMNRMVFSAFEDAKYNIYQIDSLKVLQGLAVSNQPTEVAQAPIPTIEVATYQDTAMVKQPSDSAQTATVNQAGYIYHAPDTVQITDSTKIWKGTSRRDSLLVINDTTLARTNPAMLPPVPRRRGELMTLLDDPLLGLQSGDNFHYQRYRPKLSLDYVGQPYLAAGSDPLGLQLGGGAALFWSDMLGNYNLATALQLQTDGGFTDLGALVAYQNLKRRLNWGVEAQQVPYTLIQQGAFIDANNNIVEQNFSFRQLNREAAGIVSYPFNRVFRLDFSAGYQYVSFAQKVRNITFDPSGNIISDHTVTLPSPSALNLGIASAALVYDNSIMGATSPVIGQRFHIEGMPMAGTLRLVNAIADFRKYFLPIRPFTIAFRALHYGRYGSGSEDDRLTPLFIGYQNLVRGYDVNSFNANEFQGDTTNNVFDRLFGSKIAVANAELRFPLFGALHLGGGYYGFLPLETGVFYDIGTAWTKARKPSFLSSGGRKPVRSYGVLIRFNLFGYLVLETDYVKPVDRPLKHAYWQFDITPGF